jgi:hypothetical protein
LTADFGMGNSSMYEKELPEKEKTANHSTQVRILYGSHPLMLTRGLHKGARLGTMVSRRS